MSSVTLRQGFTGTSFSNIFSKRPSMYWVQVSTQQGQFDHLSEDSKIVTDNWQHFVVQLKATFLSINSLTLRIEKK